SRKAAGVSRRSGDGTAGEQRGGFQRDRGAGKPGFSGGVCGDEQFPAYDRRTDEWNSGGGISAGGTGGCCVFPCGSGRSRQRKRSAGVRTERAVRKMKQQMISGEKQNGSWK